MATANAAASVANSAPSPPNHRFPTRPSSNVVGLLCRCTGRRACCWGNMKLKRHFLSLKPRLGTRSESKPMFGNVVGLSGVGVQAFHYTCSILTQQHNCRACLWKPSHVKSGEMEGNPSNEDVLGDEQALQQDLEKAINEENYALAAKLRDDLQLLHEDNKASVLAANMRFYQAFENGDFVAMHSIWAKGNNVCCIHPGAGAISGYDLVMDSWEVICGSEHEFPIIIDLRDVEVHIRGDIGYVTCLEVVKTKGRSWGRQVATNVFERVDGQWLMCIHHASHVEM